MPKHLNKFIVFYLSLTKVYINSIIVVYSGINIYALGIDYCLIFKVPNHTSFVKLPTLFRFTGKPKDVYKETKICVRSNV